MPKTRKKAAGTIRVYKYGLMWPDKETCAVLAQDMEDARHYYNEMVDLYKRKTIEFRNQRYKLYPELAGIDAQISQIDDAKKQLRKNIKDDNIVNRACVPDELCKSRIDELNNRLKPLYEKKRRLLEIAKKDRRLQKFSKMGNDLFNEEQRAIRKFRRCSWGTGGLVEESAKVAAKTSFGEPRRKVGLWNGSGTIRSQIQSGASKKPLTVSRAFDGVDNRLKLEKIPGYDAKRLQRSKRLMRCTIQLGQHIGEKPKQIDLTILYHRPLPVDAKITNVLIKREMVGYRQVWSIGFVLQLKKAPKKPDRATSGTVGIDVGWRLVDGGLKTVYCVDGQNYRKSILIPQQWLDKWDVLDCRIGERKNSFNSAVERVAAWAKGMTTVPEWLIDVGIEHISKWRSPARMHALFKAWEQNRIVGDMEMFDWLASWVKSDSKEYTSIEGTRRRLRHQRDAAYIKRIIRLRRLFKTAVVEDIELCNLQKTKQPEHRTEENKNITKNMRHAAVGRFLELLTAHFGSENIIKVNPANTSATCPHCGHLRKLDPKEIVQECSNCGEAVHRDFGAAQNILRHGLSRRSRESRSGEAPFPMRNKELCRGFSGLSQKESQNAGK